MIDLKAIRLALRTKAVNVAGWAALNTAGKIAYENATFRPPALPTDATTKAVIWGSESLFVEGEDHVSFGYVSTLGSLVLRVIVPKGQGIMAADDLLKALADEFRPGQTVQYGVSASETIHIDRTSRLSGADFEENWYGLGLLVSWRGYSSN